MVVVPCRRTRCIGCVQTRGSTCICIWTCTNGRPCCCGELTCGGSLPLGSVLVLDSILVPVAVPELNHAGRAQNQRLPRQRSISKTIMLITRCFKTANIGPSRRQHAWRLADCQVGFPRARREKRGNWHAVPQRAFQGRQAPLLERMGARLGPPTCFANTAGGARSGPASSLAQSGSASSQWPLAQMKPGRSLKRDPGPRPFSLKVDGSPGPR
jgi:hypothetical protein